MKVEAYQDKAGEWRWRLKAKNGRIIADGAEGYKTKSGIKRAVKSFWYKTHEIEQAFENIFVELDDENRNKT